MYKWPLLNKGVSIYTPQFCTVCPCDLFIVTLKANLIGNCLLLNKNGDSSSSGYKLIRGMNIVCPFCGPDKTLASITYCLIVLTINRVPLHNPFKFRINITIAFGYKCNSCGGSPATSNSLRNSTGYSAACPSSTGVFVL